KVVTETLKETTQSQHLRTQTNPLNSIFASLFKKAYSSSPPSSDSTTPLPQSMSANTIILFDDVDVVFDGNEEPDEGFWRAVKNIIQETKVPVVMTASSLINDLLEDKLSELSICQINLAKPSSSDIVPYLLSICEKELSKESLTLEDDLIITRIRKLVHDCDCDIRQCINYLQFYGCSM